MLGKYLDNRAETIFEKNIGNYVEVELVDGCNIMGILISISCNTFITLNNEGLNEMFRYEDVRYLKAKKCDKEKQKEVFKSR